MIEAESIGPAELALVPAAAGTPRTPTRLTVAVQAHKTSMAVLGLIVAASGITAPPAQAAEAVAAAEVPTCAVPHGMIHNLPKNTIGQGDISSDDQFHWHRTMQCMFDAAPKGSKIMIAIFSWADQPSADALRAADARGVTVQLIMWNGRTSSVMPEFAKSLNDGLTPGSYFKVCKGACLGPRTGSRAPGIHHSKVLTFSQVNLPGGQVAKNITSIGTGNFSTSNAERSFNVWRIVPNNPAMYNAASAHIARMRADKDRRTSKAKKIALGDTAMYLYPQKSHTPDLSSISSRPRPVGVPRRPSGLLSTCGPSDASRSLIAWPC